MVALEPCVHVPWKGPKTEGAAVGAIYLKWKRERVEGRQTQLSHRCSALLFLTPRGISLITQVGGISPDTVQCGFLGSNYFGIKKARFLGRGVPKELSDYSEQPSPGPTPTPNSSSCLRRDW